MARILILDDDDQIRALMKQLLEKQGHEIFEANDGETGLQMFTTVAPEIVISDLIMPGKDGIMAIQEMLSTRPSVKVIAVSGGATGNSAWLPIAKRAGAMRILRKPFEGKQLLDTVNEVALNDW